MHGTFGQYMRASLTLGFFLGLAVSVITVAKRGDLVGFVVLPLSLVWVLLCGVIKYLVDRSRYARQPRP